jgi:hypothetical protein
MRKVAWEASGCVVRLQTPTRVQLCCLLQVPWDDLRYVFGEIMYGGHIVEDWDRRLAAAYLLKYFNEGLLEGMEMFPGFNTPANSLSHKQVRQRPCHSEPCQAVHALQGGERLGCSLQIMTLYG